MTMFKFHSKIKHTFFTTPGMTGRIFTAIQKFDLHDLQQMAAEEGLKVRYAQPHDMKNEKERLAPSTWQLYKDQWEKDCYRLFVCYKPVPKYGRGTGGHSAYTS